MLDFFLELTAKPDKSITKKIFGLDTQKKGIDIIGKDPFSYIAFLIEFRCSATIKAGVCDQGEMSVIIQLSPDDERENEYVKDVKRSTRRESSSCETIHTELTYDKHMTNYLKGSLQKNVQLFWIIYYLKKKTS